MRSINSRDSMTSSDRDNKNTKIDLSESTPEGNMFGQTKADKEPDITFPKRQEDPKIELQKIASQNIFEKTDGKTIADRKAYVTSLNKGEKGQLWEYLGFCFTIEAKRKAVDYLIDQKAEGCGFDQAFSLLKEKMATKEFWKEFGKEYLGIHTEVGRWNSFTLKQKQEYFEKERDNFEKKVDNLGNDYLTKRITQSQADEVKKYLSYVDIESERKILDYLMTQEAGGKKFDQAFTALKIRLAEEGCWIMYGKDGAKEMAEKMARLNKSEIGEKPKIDECKNVKEVPKEQKLDQASHDDILNSNDEKKKVSKIIITKPRKQSFTGLIKEDSKQKKYNKPLTSLPQKRKSLAPQQSEESPKIYAEKLTANNLKEVAPQLQQKSKEVKKPIDRFISEPGLAGNKTVMEMMRKKQAKDNQNRRWTMDDTIIEKQRGSR
jgi:hypothetical protein